MLQHSFADLIDAPARGFAWQVFRAAPDDLKPDPSVCADNRIAGRIAPGEHDVMFETFIGPLSDELGIAPSRKSGRSHAITQQSSYTKRIAAINFAMSNDDGVHPENFSHADVVLTGVSRSGKTPTCLYLAMHFGLRAANYPLTEEDFERGDVPPVLWQQKPKLFGLTIDPQRLQSIREERRPGSSYSSARRCQAEVRQAQTLFKRLQITVLNTTSHSIEEIATRIMQQLKLR